MSYLSIIENALWAAAKQQLPAGVLAHKRLGHAIVERSRLYTSERELLDEPPPAGGTADVAARALFFSIADAAKIRIPITELVNRGVFPAARPLRVLDLGAGAGAMSLGLASIRADDCAVELTAVDRDEAALRLLRGAVAELPDTWRAGFDVRVVAADVRRWTPPEPGFDLIMAGSVLNELTRDAAFDAVSAWLSWLREDGAVIIVEPALRETARALQALRDHILEADRGHVFAPCTRRAAPCPGLADERDWCHEDRPVQLPERTQQLVNATGLRSYGLKFSYLVLRREPAALVDPAGERAALRVVSRPRKLKGRRECFVCGEHGRTALRLLKRNRSAANRAVESARRGDVVVAVPRADVLADDAVDIVCPSAGWDD